MSDELDGDDSADPTGLALPPTRGQQLDGAGAPRLVARLYAGADPALRTRMLACLMRPLGPLGLAAIASGAFASFLARATPTGLVVVIEDAARYSSAQVYELARFAEQVSPEALQQFASLFNEPPLGLAAASAAALSLLVRTLQRSSGPALTADEGAMARNGAPVASHRNRSERRQC